MQKKNCLHLGNGEQITKSECEKLKKENEIDRESIMEDVVLEWNSNIKKKNKKICDNHVSEHVKKDCKKMDVLKFEIFERVKLMAKTYNKSITKMMFELIEKGYIKMLDNK